VLWWQPYGLNLFMSKGKPLVNPQDIAGRNVRALDKGTAEFITLCGGKPEVISGSKMLDALTAGKVDAVMTGALGIKERELWRETQFVNRLRHSAILFVVIINEKVWQGLTPAQQALLQAQALKVETMYWDQFARLEQEAYRFAAEKNMTVKEMTSDDLSDWRMCSSELVERFVEKLGETAAGLMSAYGKLRVGLEKQDVRAAATK
jgi:C4-dicarboxylate-binding protein DctP